MKALSIKQPWAWLICAGYKDIENRDWFIGRKPALGGSFQGRGLELPARIYVHTGKNPDADMEGTLDFIKAIDGSLYRHIFSTIMNDSPGLDLGAIIGEVTITGCVTQSDSPWFAGKYGFTLSRPILYNVPIPYKGKLGFFEVHLDEQNRGYQAGT
jgi:hypothetical protein